VPAVSVYCPSVVVDLVSSRYYRFARIRSGDDYEVSAHFWVDVTQNGKHAACSNLKLRLSPVANPRLWPGPFYCRYARWARHIVRDLSLFRKSTGFLPATTRMWGTMAKPFWFITGCCSGGGKVLPHRIHVDDRKHHSPRKAYR